MPAAGVGSMLLEPSNRDLLEVLPTSGMRRVLSYACSLEIVKNFERFTDLRVILLEAPC